MQSRRLWVVVVLLPVLSSSCLFRDSPQRAADELAAISGTVTEATYAAIYRFGVTGALAGAVTTRMEIVQDPPVSLRKLDTTTQPEEGEPITLTSWFVRNADGDFACTQYQNIGVRCLADTIARGTFGNAQLDAFFDTPRESSSFSSVRKTSRPVRIQGEQGTCYEAVPASESDSAADSAQPTVASERFRFELCYAEDGILLRGRRTNLAEAEAAGSASSLVELVSLSRVVEPRELRLPGQVVEPDAVRQ
jgi:hypothetical protein